MLEYIPGVIEMELRVLEYFLAIAKEQSIIKAAHSLHLSQPTLSIQIKKLEEELGKPLLIRGSKGTRKVTLTEEGMILKKRAEEILSLVNKAEKEIMLSDSIIIGDIDIATGESEGVRTIAKCASMLCSTNPGIHYHLYSGNSDFVLDKLDNGLVDFGIVFDQVDLKVYNSVLLPPIDTWGVLMRSDSPLASREYITPEDLWDKPLIVSQAESSGGEVIQWLGKDVEELNIIATYNLLFNTTFLVEEGLGYAICFNNIICTCEDGDLVFRPLEPTLTAHMYLVYKKSKSLSKPAEKFLEILKEEIIKSED